MPEKLKVNLHLTQMCNYHCRHCFAHFPDRQDLSLSEWKAIIDNLSRSGLVDSINFAGGEPVLYRWFPELALYAHGKGFRLSIITNGSLLQKRRFFPEELFPLFDMFGFSIDSLNAETLRKIGRCDENGITLSGLDFVSLVSTIKSHNPKAQIKINTVVSKLNRNEKLVRIEEDVLIDRWKFLKIKPFATENFSNKKMLVSDRDFDIFVARNHRNYGETVVERTLERSYLVIDNAGNLLDNHGESYAIVGNLLHEPFVDVLRRFELDEREYRQRYAARQEAQVQS